MQKVQILNGTPGPTFLVTSASAARGLALDRILKGNLITNGDMEADANWASYGTPATNERSTTKVTTGDYSRKFTPNAANEGIQGDVFTTITGQKQHYTIWVFPDDGTVVSVIIRQGDNLANLLNVTYTGLTENAWNEIKIDVTELGGGALGYLVVHSGAQTSGDFYVANIFGSHTSQAGQHGARKASRMFITVDTDEILWAVGGTTPVSEGLGHQAFPISATEPNPHVILQNFDAIKSFKYIDQTASSAAKLYITVEF